jgi:hypothetical protein
MVAQLNKMFIYGGTAQIERMRILQNFQHNPLVRASVLRSVAVLTLPRIGQHHLPLQGRRHEVRRSPYLGS